MSESTQHLRERRHDARVAILGTVLLHGDVPAHGLLVDVSAHSLRFQVGACAGTLTIGAAVELEMRIDGSRASWWRLRGRVERIDDSGAISISLGDAPDGFADEIHDELVAGLERSFVVRALVVDPDPRRRAALARRLRADGYVVDEVATPLEAIACVGEPRTRPDLVLIADTIPLAVADDLRAFFTRIDGPPLLFV